MAEGAGVAPDAVQGAWEDRRQLVLVATVYAPAVVSVRSTGLVSRATTCSAQSAARRWSANETVVAPQSLTGGPPGWGGGSLVAARDLWGGDHESDVCCRRCSPYGFVLPL